MNLSKSQYIRGLQCHKSLWLLKNRPELREVSKESELLFKKGISVGELAKELFPNGVEIEFDSDNFRGMIDKTKELIVNGTKVIYEATFSDEGMFAMVDILVRNGERWDMYEVKGATSARDKGIIKSQYLNDAAIQWYVLSKSIDLGRAYIVHLDNTYERNGDLDVQQLFASDDITNEVKEEQSQIQEKLSTMDEMLKGDMPNIDIGTHCDSPYPCDFSEHCWQHIPKKNSVFHISYAYGKQWALYRDGIVHLDDVPLKYPLSANASLQLKYFRSQEIKIDKEKIKKFLDGIEYPINFFDFETFQNPIPRFDKQRPYQQVPFQYSLHILYEDSTLEHKEFLGDELSDPRSSLIEQMLQDITPTGSIVAYHKSFEETQIRNLAVYSGKKSEALLALIDRFVDLEKPFSYKDYYHPGFNGRSSIKVVLPTLYPNAPELDYKKLGSIQNGGDAMDTFANLHLLKDPSQREAIREDLLAYCHLDTLAMVRIWEQLNKIVTM